MLLGNDLESPPSKDAGYMYLGKLVRVIDGDTFEIRVELGFYVSTVQRFRLAKVDAPERRGSDRAAGLVATNFCVDWFGSRLGLVLVKCFGTDKYGRWVADVKDRVTLESLHDALLSGGHARRYK